MKTIIRIFPIAAIMLLFSACSTSKEQKPETSKTENNQAESKTSNADFISGTVTEIQPGKDGYTAQIITTTGEVFFVTISRANLTNPDTYRSVKVGESISVKGEQWQMENQNHITVRELK